MSLASVTERRLALSAAWPTWQPRTLAQALDEVAARHPDRPLILTDERVLSYREVSEASRRIASGLIAHGLNPGEHVAVVMANYPEFVLLKFAIARAGAVAVPINFLLRREELGYVLAQSDAAMLVTMSRFRDLDYLEFLDQLAPEWVQDAGELRCRVCGR